jgi:S1-C subfamily serine protease
VWLADAVDGGVQIYAVVPGGPALAAGLHAGDVILTADGVVVADQGDLGRVLDARAPGQRMQLRVLRAGDTLDLPIELGTRGPDVTAPLPTPVPRGPWNDEAPGIDVAEMTADLRKHYGAPADTGVLVVRVEPDSPAARAGLRVGDVLVSAGGIPLTEPSLVRVTLSPWLGGNGEIVAIRAGERVKLAAPAPPSESAPEAGERQALERRLELEIDRLERRLRDLRRELDGLRERD